VPLEESDLTIRCVINTFPGRTTHAGAVEDRSRRRRKASPLAACQEINDEATTEENQEKDDLIIVMVEEGNVLFVPHPSLGDQL